MGKDLLAFSLSFSLSQAQLTLISSQALLAFEYCQTQGKSLPNQSTQFLTDIVTSRLHHAER